MPLGQCKGAFLGLHFAPTSSAYVENVWNWVADHITEDFSGGSNIAAKGGALVESTRGTWLHGLGSEHWWLYQLNLRKANNVMISLLQSETNYDQETTPSRSRRRRGPPTLPTGATLTSPGAPVAIRAAAWDSPTTSTVAPTSTHTRRPRGRSSAAPGTRVAQERTSARVSLNLLPSPRYGTEWLTF